MKNSIKFLAAGSVACSLLSFSVPAYADTTVTVDPGAAWLGWMNVSELPQNGGAFVFGSAWGIPDLTATWAGPVVTLGPNSVNDPNSFWYTPSGGPGSTGNKIMDANLYVETTGVYTGQTLTFTGTVLSNTLAGNLDANGNGWTTRAFIKDFAADYGSFNVMEVDLAPGDFSISLALENDAARHVQFGFQTIGPNVWITDVEPFGNVQITAVPEPSTLALLGLGLVAMKRRRKSA